MKYFSESRPCRMIVHMASPKHSPVNELHVPDARPSLVIQTLLTMARQRDGVSESRCQTVLEFLEIGGVVRNTVLQQFGREGLSRVKFAVLLALSAIDPISASPSDLALHTGATRPCVSEALAGLVRQRLVVCQRGNPDRRFIYACLTEAGRKMADESAMRCLRLLEQIAHRLPATLQTNLRLGCALLQEGALSSAPVT